MVLNMYDNLGISNVNNYLNIRVELKEDAKIIGKMTSKSAVRFWKRPRMAAGIRSSPVRLLAMLNPNLF